MIVFDMSRLVARARFATPTGIDRVELAYVQYLIANAKPTHFAIATPWGGLALLPSALVGRYVEALAGLWREGSSLRRRGRVRWAALRLRLASWERRRFALGARMQDSAVRPTYLLVSHHHLDKQRVVARLKKQHAMLFVCLIHDLIPIEFPEYSRPGHDKRHRRRIDTATALADAVIVPSTATGDALRPYIERTGSALRVVTAPLGVEPRPIATTGPALPGGPYFVCLGTIEPRKNHLLLLNLWRDIVVEHGKDAPALVLIGRRGWENENTIDMLDRCRTLRGIVTERSAVSDNETARLVKNALALLMPSFAEGFGFPLVEALALGSPVLASDLPALRQIGGGVPEYFDPIDGAAWRAAILDYSLKPSPRREAQLERLAEWRPPRWEDHFSAVEALIEDLAAGPTPV